ncbi:GNAT family N-acetyltransferase [Microbacterium sp. ARD31]|uniref:GNAT family N-acetyltransferase n=1 Tax=Microbacterium sp. ARD31 TaxID=2962576 RepID=UPI0028815E89|nr:GNAT family N-acetyltransferase [Microbacterium sp. ARD31]MDT0187808.1 GNAT family N-acetyltransferase [Microbacterium sp. ARD31]
MPEPGGPGAPRVVVRHGGRELTGTVLPGESWAAAAARVAATTGVTPVAEDLSGGDLLFVADPDQRIDLRAMTYGDLPGLTRWLQAPHVRRWWRNDGEPTREAVEARYGPRIDGRTPTRMWVVEVNGRSVGFVQDYLVRDYPGFALLTPDPDALGLDYAIGEPQWAGRGLGARVLWSWMLGARHRHPEATAYFAAPEHTNHASLRVLDKVGFTRGTWFDEPQRDGTTSTAIGCTLDVPRVLGPAEAPGAP